MNTTKAMSYNQINAVKYTKDFLSAQPEPAIRDAVRLNQGL